MSYNCTIEDESSPVISCTVQLPRTSVYHAVARLNFCRSPAELDVTLEADDHVWQHSFIASNGYETRAVGRDYWPILLHSSFEDPSASGESLNGTSSTILVKACLQAVKPKSTVCFLNHLVTENSPSRYRCDGGTNRDNASIVTFSLVCFLIAFVFLTTLLVMLVWWRRMRRFKRIWKLSRQPLLPPPIPGSKPYLSTIARHDSNSSSSEDVSKMNVIKELSPSRGIATHLPVPPNQKFFYTNRYQKVLSRKFWNRHNTSSCTTSTNTELLQGCLVSPGYIGDINSASSSSSSGSSDHRDSKLVQTSTTSLEDTSSEGNIHSPPPTTFQQQLGLKQPLKESPL